MKWSYISCCCLKEKMQMLELVSAQNGKVRLLQHIMPLLTNYRLIRVLLAQHTAYYWSLLLFVPSSRQSSSPTSFRHWVDRVSNLQNALFSFVSSRERCKRDVPIPRARRPATTDDISSIWRLANSFFFNFDIQPLLWSMRRYFEQQNVWSSRICW